MIYVRIPKTGIVINAELVIKISPRKVQVEIWLIEIEDAIVISGVNILLGIIDSKIAVAER